MSDQEKLDDLLDVVEELDQATENLQAQMDENQTQNKTLESLSGDTSFNSSRVTLEAAKAAQEAANQSHDTTLAALKLAEELHTQTKEINNANFNLRRSVRHASEEITSNKKLFISMLIVSVVLAFTSVGVMVGASINSTDQQKQLKGEILDVIQTENALFTKALNVKIDDLANQIEASRFYLEQLASNNKTTAPTEQQEVIKPVQTDQPHSPATNSTVSTESQLEVMQILTSLEKQQNAFKQELTVKVAELQKQYQQLQAGQKQIAQEIKTKSPQNGPVTNLNDKQSQQLADIRWLTSKHDRQLKEISRTLKDIGKNNLGSQTLARQLDTLEKQQTLINLELKRLQQSVQKIPDQIKEQQPYSYRAK